MELDEIGALWDAVRQLERIADGQQELGDWLERAADGRHRELMRALEEIRAQLEKIERTQYE